MLGDFLFQLTMNPYANTSMPYWLPGVYTRSPCSQRAAYAGGLAQNSTDKCSGEPGNATGVELRALTVGAPRMKKKIIF
jgi:hypothetical protein